MKKDYSNQNIINSFGLDLGGKLLDRYCINKDINKCKKCKFWNCCRDIGGIV